jgi:prepilin-type N-terminal cleavage/methylation domain-containing protein
LQNNQKGVWEMVSKKECSKNLTSAFTLAEVLITLGIIGVVAAITLPTLIQNYKKQVYVNQLKKSVSTIEQGLKKIIADEGVDSLRQISEFEHCNWSGENHPYYMKFFKAVVAKPDSLYPDGYYYLNGEHLEWWENKYDIFYFNDGSLVSFEINTANNKNYAGYVFIDINGDKKLPNKLGRDMFYFVVLDNGNLTPEYGKIYSGNGYWRNNTELCGNANSSELPNNVKGWGCAARIIENGWKMDY